MGTDEGIDFVITWVDGGDPAWCAERRRYAEARGLATDARYRDWGLLRYWFRSVEAYAPWVRKIHFVTWGHLPSWLDVTNPKLHVVRHSDFIPAKYLPTFNSHTIELNLHRIEGLAEKFVYFNDDVYLLRPTAPEFFFRNGLPCDTFGLNAPHFSSRTIGTIAAASVSVINDNFAKAAAFKAHGRKFYDRRNGLMRVLRTRLLSRVCRTFFPGFDHWHVTYSFLKSTFREVWAAAGETLDATCADRFRGRHNVSPCTMKYWQLASGRFAPRGTKEGMAIHMSSPETVLRARDAILRRSYNVACLNDTSFLVDVEDAIRQLTSAFETNLPKPSSFEKDGGCGRPDAAAEIADREAGLDPLQASDRARRVAILNFHFEASNFGAVLTAYALNRALNEMGHSARNVDFRPPLPRLLRKRGNPAFEAFRRQRMSMTVRIENTADLNRLNGCFDSFVVGSDQVWNPKLTEWFADVYFLSFVRPGRRLISAAASFGDAPETLFARDALVRMLSAFDAVSVREQGAAASLAKFGVKAQAVADPVFLLPAETWRKLAAESHAVPPEDACVWYGVNAPGRNAIAKYLPACWSHFRGGVVHLKDMDVEDWLARIASASLLVTDSFHGTCFALIFGVPFAVISPKGTKSGRMRDLLKAVGLEDRIFENVSEMPSPEVLAKPYDVASVQARLRRMGDEFRQYLSDSLAKPFAEEQVRQGALLDSQAALRRFASRAAMRFALRTPFACLKALCASPFKVGAVMSAKWKLSVEKVRGYRAMASRLEDCSKTA